MYLAWIVNYWDHPWCKRFDEVSLQYLPRILETHPLETWRIREMSQGRAPEWANSTIFWRVWSGRGRPLTNTPPSWFTPLWPGVLGYSCNISSTATEHWRGGRGRKDWPLTNAHVPQNPNSIFDWSIRLKWWYQCISFTSFEFTMNWFSR